MPGFVSNSLLPTFSSLAFADDDDDDDDDDALFLSLRCSDFACL
jgi:hypothetical protein